MKKDFKLISLVTVLVLVLSIGIVGCTMRRTEKPNTPYNNSLNNPMQRSTDYSGNITDYNNPNLNRNINDNIMDRNINYTEQAVGDNTTKIADKVEDLKEVNRATVVISGNTCLVGVDINDNIEGNMTTSLKNKIDKIVKDTDRNITNVSVTANADLYKRIENMGRDIRAGRPLSGFANEIEEIIRRITPIK